MNVTTKLRLTALKDGYLIATMLWGLIVMIISVVGLIHSWLHDESFYSQVWFALGGAVVLVATFVALCLSHRNAQPTELPPPGTWSAFFQVPVIYFVVGTAVWAINAPEHRSVSLPMSTSMSVVLVLMMLFHWRKIKATL